MTSLYTTYYYYLYVPNLERLWEGIGSEIPYEVCFGSSQQLNKRGVPEVGIDFVDGRTGLDWTGLGQSQGSRV